MPLHGLIHIQGMHTRRIKAGEPHIPHDHHLQRIIRRLKAFLQILLHLAAIDMRTQQRFVAGGTRHDDLDRTLLRVGIMPFRSQLNNLVIEVDANLTAHSHHHGFAVLSLLPLVKVVHQVGRNTRNARFRTYHLFQGGPLGFQLCLVALFFVFSQLINILIQLRQLRFI